ncbi:MAG TPA: aminopeptidase P family N-terminal domain-containing protein, partial [Anaerolineales bacterium]
MKSDIDALMQSHNLDAILVLGDAEHNPPMYYLTGGGHISAATLFKKRGEAPLLVHNDMERGEAERTGLATRSYSEYPLDPELESAGDMATALALQLKAILTDAGFDHGRMGVYGRLDIGTALAILMKLRELLPDVELVGEYGMTS